MRIQHGSAPPGGTLGSSLGTVQVTDDRGFGADWTATVSSTGFATGTGTQAETIPAADAQYLIAALAEAIGPASFTPGTRDPTQRQPAARRQRHQRVRKYHGQLGSHHPGERPLHRHQR